MELTREEATVLHELTGIAHLLRSLNATAEAMVALTEPDGRVGRAQRHALASLHVWRRLAGDTGHEEHQAEAAAPPTAAAAANAERGGGAQEPRST